MPRQYVFASKRGMNFVQIINETTRQYDGLVKIFVPGQSVAGHWVSPTGAVTYTASYSANPLSGAACCSLDAALAGAVAGDKVILRGGTYTRTGKNGFAPANSGTTWANRIIFSAYAGETPLVISGSSGSDYWGLALSGRSYIQILGIGVVDFWRFAMIDNFAHHIEVGYCPIYSQTGENVAIGFQMDEQNILWTGYVHDIWVHHNIIHTAHNRTAGQVCVEGDDLLRIGQQSGTGSTAMLNHHITVENNVLYAGGHVLLDNYGQYTVVKNNVMHNEPWVLDYGSGTCPWAATYDTAYAAYNGKYGHRCTQVSRDGTDANSWSLYEGNRIGWGSVNPNNDGADCLDLAASRILARFNDIYQAMNNGVYFKYPFSNLNTVIFNTIHRCGKGYVWKYSSNNCPNNVCPDDMAAISFGYNNQQTGHFVMYNIAYQSESYAERLRDIIDRGGAAPWAGHGIIGPNWTTANGDPMFTNPVVDLANPGSLISPDLSLQAGSPCIGAAGKCATAVGSGSGSTTLVVDRASPFQDGTWGADMTWGVTLFPDWIAIGTVDNIVPILAINYATNTITLAASMSWANGASVWIYKDSSGNRMLYGSAPEYGAHAYPR